MESTVVQIIFSFFISFFLTFFLVPIFSTIAKKFNILDIPDGAIKMHKIPTPYLGGVAVYLGFMISLIFTFPLNQTINFLLLGSTILLLLGLVDDILRIKPYQKFFWQLIVAFYFLKSGIYLKEAFFFGSMLNLPISFLWILTIINAFNLIDVMDGLATTVASCITITFFIIALLFGQPNLALLLICFLGALLGFFVYNKPPAQIYLGDTGSLFIGGFLATIPFLFTWNTNSFNGVIASLLIFAIPLLEVTTLIIIRTYKKIPFYNGSPDHFSMYLQHGGWSKYKILCFVLLLSSFLFVLSLLFALNMINIFILGIALSLFLAVWFITIWNNAKRIYL